MFFDRDNSIDIFDSSIIYHNNNRLDLFLESPSYLSINTDNNEQIIPTSLTLINWSRYSLNLSNNNIKLNTTDDKIYILISGIYEFNFSLLCEEVNSGSPEIDIRIYKNGSLITNMSQIIKLSGVGITGNLNLSFIESFDSGDTIGVYEQRTGGSEVVAQISLTIKQIGG